MSWFPSSAPVVSLHLIDKNSHEEPFVIDVFPKRWTVQRGFEDAILSFLAGYAQSERHTNLGIWAKHNDNTLISTGYTCDDYAFAKGGFVAHNGQPVEQHTLTFQMDGHDVVLPDGTRIAVGLFTNATKNAYHHTIGPHYRNVLHTNLQQDVLRQNAISFFLGVAEAFVASPMATELDMDAHEGGFQFAAIAARAMRHLAFVQRSGKDSIQWIQKKTQKIAKAFFHAWVVRPNRGWAAERWVLGDIYQELVALYPNPIQRMAGKAAGDAFFARTNDFTTLLYDDPEASAHAQLFTRHLRNQVEDAALTAYAANPTLIKPMSARRSAQLISCPHKNP
jgi:hypothetical protein